MGSFRKHLKRVLSPFLRWWLRFYYRKPRKFAYQGIEVMVDPSVFPPQLTLSTRILLDYIHGLDLREKSFLELGCGSGIISLFARKKGAEVTASDINEKAIHYLKRASSINRLEMTVLYSDLFDALYGKSFDYIIINPPYYPKDPKNVQERAWFCGQDFDYFKKLFSQLPAFLDKNNNTYMILSEDCAIDTIVEIASKNGIRLYEELKVRKMGETNFIYSTKR